MFDIVENYNSTEWLQTIYDLGKDAFFEAGLNSLYEPDMASIAYNGLNGDLKVVRFINSDGNVIGYQIWILYTDLFIPKIKRACLKSIFILKGHRGQSTFKRFLDFGIKKIKGLGYTDLVILTNKETRFDTLISSLGYQPKNIEYEV